MKLTCTKIQETFPKDRMSGERYDLCPECLNLCWRQDKTYICYPSLRQYNTNMYWSTENLLRWQSVRRKLWIIPSRCPECLNLCWWQDRTSVSYPSLRQYSTNMYWSTGNILRWQSVRRKLLIIPSRCPECLVILDWGSTVQTRTEVHKTFSDDRVSEENYELYLRGVQSA